MTKELILQYQKSPTPELEQQLLQAHGDYISANANKWKGVLPDVVIDTHAKKHALQAFKTFDPEKANINTHLYNHLSQLSRLVYEHQNVAKIPEHQLQMIGKVEQARSYLTDQLGREPEHHEIADHMHLPTVHIERIVKNNRADFLNDSDAETQQFASGRDTRLADRIFAYRQALDDKKKKQFDALTGFNNSPVLSPQEFGKQFKLKPYEVSRLKAYFAKGLK